MKGYTEVKFACGCIKNQLIERVQNSDWYAKTVCYDCKNAAVSEFNRKIGMTPLKGTPRQITWAENIRHEVLGRLSKINQALPELNLVTKIKSLFKKSKATYWIDRRDQSIFQWIDLKEEE